MATQKFSAMTSRGTVVTTELNSLANNTYSAVSPVLDNGTNLDQFGIAQLDVTFGTNPTVDTTVDLFAVPAPDGTNYEDGGGAVKPAAAYYCGSFQLRAVTTPQKIATSRFELPPCKVKFVVFNNNTGQTFAASGNTVTLFTFNLTVN